MSDRQLSLHDQLSLCQMTVRRKVAEYSLLIRSLSAAMQGMYGTEGTNLTKRHFCCLCMGDSDTPLCAAPGLQGSPPAFGLPWHPPL